MARERVSFKVEDFEEGKRKLRKKVSNEVRGKRIKKSFANEQ